MDSTKNSKKSASFHSAQNPLALMIDVCFADFSFKSLVKLSEFCTSCNLTTTYGSATARQIRERDVARYVSQLITYCTQLIHSLTYLQLLHKLWGGSKLIISLFVTAFYHQTSIVKGHLVVSEHSHIHHTHETVHR
jgi:hypothetical protein